MNNYHARGVFVQCLIDEFKAIRQQRPLNRREQGFLDRLIFLAHARQVRANRATPESPELLFLNILDFKGA